MTEADFNSLLNQLGSNVNCVLVLGPEFINIDSAERDYTESIHDFLVKKKSYQYQKTILAKMDFCYTMKMK